MSILTLQRAHPQPEDTQSALMIVCAWCGRERHKSIWRAIRLPRFGKPKPISHGICPECYDKQVAKLSAPE
jgi:hypothetical protein